MGRFQVRSDIAIRRHQTLVHCAFAFCWNTVWAGRPPAVQAAEQTDAVVSGERGTQRQRAVAVAELAHDSAHGPGLAAPWIMLRRCWLSPAGDF